MGQRIRYIKVGEMLESTRWIKVKDGDDDFEVTVRIDPVNNIGKVIGGEVIGIHEVRGTSLHKVKIAVKEKLIELGAVFEKEERNGNDPE